MKITGIPKNRIAAIPPANDMTYKSLEIKKAAIPLRYNCPFGFFIFWNYRV
jgi:hypothetical protein